MRRLPHVGASSPPLAIIGAGAGARDSRSFQGYLVRDGQTTTMPCLRCPDAPCRRPAAADLRDLCPVDVLSRADSPQGVMVGHGCVQCGVCVTRCPVGALAFTDQGARVAMPADAVDGVISSSVGSFLEWRRSVEVPIQMTKSERRALVQRLTARASGHLQGPYYRLVESLFNALGIEAKQSNHGDTSNRIDLILTDDEAPIPVEIKSRSEVSSINWKSVQQALENKLTMARLSGHADLNGSSSLVVGHEYPAARSGITELVDEIEAAFGIRIGLVSLWRLYDFLVGLAMGEPPPSRNVFAALEGEL